MNEASSRPPRSLAPTINWGDGESREHVVVRVARYGGAPVPGGLLDAQAAVPKPRPLLWSWRRNAVLLLADAVAMAVGHGMALVVLDGLYGTPSLIAPSVALAVSVLCIAAYAASGLYSAFPLPPVEEVRTFGAAVTAVCVAVGVSILAGSGAGALPTAVYLLTLWGAVLLGTPLLRAAVRRAYAPRPWWGCPVVVLGAGAAARRVVRLLQLQPELGLRPVAVLHDEPEERMRVSTVTDVPSPGGLSLAPSLALREGLRYAVVAFPQSEDHRLARVIEENGRLFRRVLVLPDFDGVASLWVGARDVGGALGFEVEHRLLVPWRRWIKRGSEVALVVTGLLVLAPFLALLGLVIRLDSAGPALFVQDRLGRGGRCFRVLKFRTMHVGAHERLREVLARDPAAREEYESFAKLTDDPRVTRVGRFLRKSSLDELPQLLNVLRGEMSLVGPRAYLPEELPRMVGKHRGILHVPPGITGLWQVSGRNELPFRMRLDLDLRYVRNWSFSLDLYLLARTVPTVLFGRGAS
jgi:Undecaprenyl-phosphate galactose phosphotransferase WbaP